MCACGRRRGTVGAAVRRHGGNARQEFLHLSPPPSKVSECPTFSRTGPGCFHCLLGFVRPKTSPPPSPPKSYLLRQKLFRTTPYCGPPSTAPQLSPRTPQKLAYKCWYAQLDAYSNVILAGERRRHSVDSRIAMRRTAAQTCALARSCGAGGRPAVVLRRPGRLAEGSSSWRSTAELASGAATPHSRQATCHFPPRFGAKMAL